MHSRGLKALEFALKKGCDYQVPRKIERGSAEDGVITASLGLIEAGEESLPSEISISNIDSVIKYTPAKLMAMLIIECFYTKNLKLLANYKEFITDELYDELLKAIINPSTTNKFNTCVQFLINNYSMVNSCYKELKGSDKIESCQHPKIVEMLFINLPTTPAVLVLGEDKFTSVCYDTWMNIDKQDLNFIYSIIETGVTPRNAIEKITRARENCKINTFMKFIEIEYLMEVFKCILV